MQRIGYLPKRPAKYPALVVVMDQPVAPIHLEPGGRPVSAAFRPQEGGGAEGDPFVRSGLQSEAHHGASQGSGDSPDGLDLGEHELAERVDIRGLG